MEPALGGIGFQITGGVLVLGLVFGWSYPFRARPPDYTAGVAIRAALGIVLGWILLVPPLMVTSGTSFSSYAFGAAILSTLTLAGSLYGVRGVRRVRRLGEAATVIASEGYAGLVVQVLWFVGGVMLGVMSQGLVWEAAEGASRRFGWPLERDPTFGTYSNAPAIDAAAALCGIAALIVAAMRWRRGPRALALGLALAAIAGTAFALS